MAEITAELNLKIAGLQQGLEKARSEMDSFKRHARTSGQGAGSEMGAGLKAGLGNVMGALGVGFGLSQVVGFAKGLVTEFAHVADVAQRFDTSAESIQRLGYHAKLAGSNVDEAANGIGKLVKNLENADDPKVAQALKELNLNARDFIGLAPDEQMALLSQGFNDAQESGRGVAAILDLVGKSGGNMVAMMREWKSVAGEGIPIVSEADVQRMKDLDDTFTRLSAKTKALGADLFTTIATVLAGPRDRKAYDEVERIKAANQEKNKEAEANNPFLQTEKEKKQAAFDRHQEEVRLAKELDAMFKESVDEHSRKEKEASASAKALSDDRMKGFKKEADAQKKLNELTDYRSTSDKIKDNAESLLIALDDERATTEEIVTIRIEGLELQKDLTDEKKKEADAAERVARADEAAATAAVTKKAQALQGQFGRNVTDAGLRINALRQGGRNQAADNLQEAVDFQQNAKDLIGQGFSPEEARQRALVMERQKRKAEGQGQHAKAFEDKNRFLAKELKGFEPVEKIMSDVRRHTMLMEQHLAAK